MLNFPICFCNKSDYFNIFFQNSVDVCGSICVNTREITLLCVQICLFIKENKILRGGICQYRAVWALLFITGSSEEKKIPLNA